jgi:hypothetical protein
MMNRFYALLSVCSLCLILSAGCSDDVSTGPITNNPDTSSVTVAFKLEPVAGFTPLDFNFPVTSVSGALYKVSMLRFYISHFGLLDSAGNIVSAQLVDSTGNPLKYEVTFFDAARPETHIFRVKARKGAYRGLILSVGVPDSTSTAPKIKLNHSDASQKTYPLDVDTDMYWTWSSGYVFFKLEGHSFIDNTWEPILYHVGGDKNYLATRVETPFTITDSSMQRTLLLNVNRLFVTPSGGNVPNIVGSPSDRNVQNGALSDSVARNISESGFFTLIQ